MSEKKKILQDIDRLLSEANSDPQLYHDNLGPLNDFVIETANNTAIRDKFSRDKETWQLIKTILVNSHVEDISVWSAEVIFLYKRLLRGVFILARNLAVSGSEIAQELLLQNIAYKIFNNSLKVGKLDDGMQLALYSTILSFLHNMSSKSVVFDRSSSKELFEFLHFPVKLNYEYTKDILLPYLLYFKDLIQHDDFLYFFLRYDKVDSILCGLILDKIMRDESQIFEMVSGTRIVSPDVNLSDIDMILLRTFALISAHESFIPYLEDKENNSFNIFIDLLKLMQLVVTNIDSWDKFQLTSIMTWTYKIFEKNADQIKNYFKNKLENEEIAKKLHAKCVITLDIMAKLCQFNHVQKFIISYKGLDQLISLLNIFQDNLIRVNFTKTSQASDITGVKATNKLGEKLAKDSLIEERIDLINMKIKETNFPECKLLIIEIIAMLTHENREIQNQVRELGGLGVILSNCVIDDNDPFIKERSIMCIKFLLKDNKENQNFVANLESKRVANDETLQEAGYEVDISKDGKLSLKSTNQ